MWLATEFIAWLEDAMVNLLKWHEREAYDSYRNVNSIGRDVAEGCAYLVTWIMDPIATNFEEKAKSLIDSPALVIALQQQLLEGIRRKR